MRARGFERHRLASRAGVAERDRSPPLFARNQENKRLLGRFFISTHNFIANQNCAVRCRRLFSSTGRSISALISEIPLVRDKEFPRRRLCGMR
jgi:hypothetical protein